MPFGTNASQCHICGKHFLCGDCITFVCCDCRPKIIETINVECPDGHGLQKARAGMIFGMKLECGCEFDSASVEGGWIRRKDTNRGDVIRQRKNVTEAGA